MQMRFNYAKHAAPAYQGMIGVETYLAGCGFDHKFMHMLKLRASQLNGCAFCIDMHWKDARAAGETEQRLYGLDAWEESPYYTDRERAALAWIEATTNLHDGHVSDAAYDRVKSHFSEKEIADLTVISAIINAWNRLAIASRSPAGAYKPRTHATT